MNAYDHEREGRTVDDTRPFNQSMPPVNEGLWLRMQYYLRQRELSFDLAKTNGWYPSSNAGDRDARIVIPATASEHNVYWQARSMEPHPVLRYQSPYAPRGDALIIVWPKDPPKGVAVSEGPMDGLAAAGEGWIGVGMMGVTPPLAALQLLVKVCTGKRTILIEDTDMNGALRRSMLFLLARGVKSELRLLYPFKDLAVVPKEKRTPMIEGTYGES